MDNITKNLIMTPFNWLYRLSPRKELELLFWLKQGYRLHLDDPKTYNEKLQWIKLYDHNPLMPACCDKYAVRQFVKEQGCGEILNTLLWEGFNPEDIPFDRLPEKYVIKVTHGSTFNIICKDGSTIDRAKAVSNCKRWLKAKFLPCYGEWFYGVEKPRVIVEKFIESADDEQLRDYKVFCFNGVPRIIELTTDRFSQLKVDFYDCDWKILQGGRKKFPQSGRAIDKPNCLPKLLEYAAKLSSPFKHARVDFYIVDEEIIFGEVTFTGGAGFNRFSTYSFDLMLGEWLDLGA